MHRRGANEFCESVVAAGPCVSEAIMISVAVVEDSAGVRKSLELMLNDSPGFRCLCACGSAEEALQVIPRQLPDVVLMDIHLPNRSGIECTLRLKQLLPAVQVIMITVYTDIDTIF